MKASQRTIILIAFLVASSCSKENSSTDHEFEKFIKFNHLYVVIDSATYNQLSNSNAFLQNFSGVVESKSDTDDESWSGKYLYGKGHYLEIFPPKGYPGAKPGNVGLGFMPTKMGTLDSLYKHWKKTSDSVDRKARTIVENGVAYPWFTSLSFHDRDSLPLRVFMLENAKEDMLYSGFKEHELEEEISWWDYMRHYRAKTRNTSPDSIKYEKLFEKVTSIQLTLGEKELALLATHLRDFGFRKEGNIFKGNDIDITYDLENNGFSLKKIAFQLTHSLRDTTYVLNDLTISIKGKEAEFRFGSEF